MTHEESVGSRLVPAIRYHDAPTAIEWLCKAFGFSEHLVVPDDSGAVAHAQLKMGNSMIMLGSARADEYNQLVRPLDDPNSPATQGVYVIVDDADAHYARAVAAGAKIVMDIKDEDYGGRGYTCRDPEGNVWSFGTYDPWA